jgi:hypothetical protein
MRDVIIGIVGVCVLAFAIRQPVVHAQVDWDIYTDANIYPGDEYDDIHIYNSSIVQMTGGTVDSIVAADNARLIVSSGYIRLLDGWGDSIIELSAGTFVSTNPSWNSTIYFSGTAQTSAAVVEGSGCFNMADGLAGFVGLWGSGIANLSGGTISDYLLATNDSQVNIYGNGLSITNSGGTYDHGQVSGSWNDGTPFLIDLRQAETYDHITLIPEPATLLLLASGCSIFLVKRNPQTRAHS